MRFNLNVNLESIEDLLKVANALKEAATLQAQLRLQQSIKELKAEKNTLSTVVQALKKERRDLKDEKADGKKAEGLEVEPAKEEDALTEEEHLSGLDDHADRIIARFEDTNLNEAEAEQL